jgi:hypothetical protein
VRKCRKSEKEKNRFEKIQNDIGKLEGNKKKYKNNMIQVHIYIYIMPH